MKRVLSMKEVLNSWRRCMENGLSNKRTAPVLHIEGEALIDSVKENIQLVSLFEDCVKRIDSSILCKCSILLIDTKGMVLKKK